MSQGPERRIPDEHVNTDRGELRKPLDWNNQPEQGGDLSPPNRGHANPYNDEAAREELDPRRGPAAPDAPDF